MIGKNGMAARQDEVLRPYVKAALAGKTAGYEALVSTYEKLVYNISLRYTGGNSADAEDITQEVFLKMWRALPAFKWESSFNTWMYRITQNACLDFVRRNQKEQTVSLSYEDDDDGEEKEVDLVDPEPLPEDRTERREQIEILRRSIDSLPELQRQIVLLRDIEGYSYLQIAEMLSLEEGTVKSRLNRARAALKTVLTESRYFESGS